MSSPPSGAGSAHHRHEELQEEPVEAVPVSSHTVRTNNDNDEEEVLAALHHRNRQLELELADTRGYVAVLEHRVMSSRTALEALQQNLLEELMVYKREALPSHQAHLYISSLREPLLRKFESDEALVENHRLISAQVDILEKRCKQLEKKLVDKTKASQATEQRLQHEIREGKVKHREDMAAAEVVMDGLRRQLAAQPQQRQRIVERLHKMQAEVGAFRDLMSKLRLSVKDFQQSMVDGVSVRNRRASSMFHHHPLSSQQLHPNGPTPTSAGPAVLPAASTIISPVTAHPQQQHGKGGGKRSGPSSRRGSTVMLLPQPTVVATSLPSSAGAATLPHLRDDTVSPICASDDDLKSATFGDFAMTATFTRKPSDGTLVNSQSSHCNGLMSFKGNGPYGQILRSVEASEAKRVRDESRLAVLYRCLRKLLQRTALQPQVAASASSPLPPSSPQGESSAALPLDWEALMSAEASSSDATMAASMWDAALQQLTQGADHIAVQHRSQRDTAKRATEEVATLKQQLEIRAVQIKSLEAQIPKPVVRCDAAAQTLLVSTHTMVDSHAQCDPVTMLDLAPLGGARTSSASTNIMTPSPVGGGDHRVSGKYFPPPVPRPSSAKRQSDGSRPSSAGWKRTTAVSQPPDSAQHSPLPLSQIIATSDSPTPSTQQTPGGSAAQRPLTNPPIWTNWDEMMLLEQAEAHHRRMVLKTCTIQWLLQFHKRKRAEMQQFFELRVAPVVVTSRSDQRGMASETDNGVADRQPLSARSIHPTPRPPSAPTRLASKPSSGPLQRRLAAEEERAPPPSAAMPMASVPPPSSSTRGPEGSSTNAVLDWVRRCGTNRSADRSPSIRVPMKSSGTMVVRPLDMSSMVADKVGAASQAVRPAAAVDIPDLDWLQMTRAAVKSTLHDRECPTPS